MPIVFSRRNMISDFLFCSDSYCLFCGEERTDGLVCGNCQSNLDFIEGVFDLEEGKCYFPLFYNNFIKEVIGNFKFRGKTYLAKPLANILLEHMKKINLLDFDYITY